MSATGKEVSGAPNGAVDNLPTGIQLTAFDETFRADPYPVLKQLRSREPVHRDQQLKRWFVTRHETVRELLRNKELSVDFSTAHRDSYAGRQYAGFLASGLSIGTRSMLVKDDPEHRRLRSLLTKSFLPKALEARRATIRANVREVLDTLTENRFDVVSSYAGPVPVIIIAEMLGIEPRDRGIFRKWSLDITGAFFNPLKIAERIERGARAERELGDYLSRVIATRKNQREGSDLISRMLAEDDPVNPLSEEQFLTQCMLMLVAGNVTTSNLIATAIKALLLHPQQLATLLANPDLIGNAVEEVLRFDGPIVQTNRILKADTTIAGCPMHAGESITVSTAAANRDPDLNPDPDRFNIQRQNIEHHAFGGGVHLCLGAHLARIEAQEAVLGLLQRFPNLVLEDQPFEYKAVPATRELSALWLRRG